MITVSNDWKQLFGCYQYPSRPRLVPETFVTIEYEQNDPDAQEDATASATTAYSSATTVDITDLSVEYPKWACLEHNAWSLDGEYNLTATHTGYISNLVAGSDGTFTTNPIITLDFTAVQTTTIPGIAITWSENLEEYARDYIVRTYNTGTLIEAYTVTDNTDVSSLVSGSIVNYNKIEIEITEWSVPNHRARIESVMLGTKKVFTKSNFISVEHNMESDLLSLDLPNYYLKFTLDNSDKSWNPDNPTGIAAYLEQRQRVTLKYGLNVNGVTEWRLAGTFYMNEWSTPQNGITADFTASSLVDFMNGKFDPSQIPSYSVGGTTTLYAVANSAFNQSNLPTDSGTAKWSIDSSLSGINVVIPNDGTDYDFDYTCAEVIQLCANASRTVIRIATDGDVIIEPLDDTLTDYTIDQFVGYTNAEYTISQQLKSVSVNDGLGTYSSSTSGENQTISNPLIQNNGQAGLVALWIGEMLEHRRELNGEYRADPRIQALDKSKNINSYATNWFFVTKANLTYAGAFQGSYEGRVVKSITNESLEGLWYSGEINANGQY